MRKPDRRHPDSSQAQASRARRGPLDEARALFEKMLGEVTRQAELERQAARSRGPVAGVLLAAATMFYGVYNFPDAPIRQTAGGYEGKGGRPRTQEDFAAFIRWKKALIVVFPAVFGLAFAQAISEARQRRTSHMTCPDGARRPIHTSHKALKGERRSADILLEAPLWRHSRARWPQRRDAREAEV